MNYYLINYIVKCEPTNYDQRDWCEGMIDISADSLEEAEEKLKSKRPNAIIFNVDVYDENDNLTETITDFNVKLF